MAGRGTTRYAEQLRETFGTQIDGLDTLAPAQKAYLSSRWLDQLSSADRPATRRHDLTQEKR